MHSPIPAEYVVELPKGIPVLSGHFGTVKNEPTKERRLSFFHDWDLLFVEKGDCSLHFGNQETLHIPEGHFLLLPPATPAWLQHSRSTTLGFCHFSFNPIPDNVFPSVRNDCLERDKKVLIPWTFPKNKARKIWLAYRQVIGMKFDSKHPWRMACAISRLVSELGSFAIKLDLPEKHPFPNPDNGIDRRVIDIYRRICRNPLNPWRVSELAASVGISAGHIDRLFQANLKTTLKSIIIEQRLQRALSLIERSHLGKRQSMKEISVQCGFTSQHFFSRQFKKYYGVSPLKYRFTKC